MKIGVVTTQYASNYGALLQAYALQHYLNSCGWEEEVLAYCPPHWKSYWRLLPQITGGKSFLLFCFALATPWRLLGKARRFRADQGFRKTDISCSRDFFSKEEIEAQPCRYDALICGSDQIWNVTRHKTVDPVWFLSLDGAWSGVKKIAYAPSVADLIPEDKKPIMRQYLQGFSAVSVREKSDVEQIAALWPGQVRHVCDPVFLLSPAEWRKLAKAPKEKEPYILCYFLNPSREAAEIVQRLRRLTGLRVVHLDVNPYDKLRSDRDVLSAGPREFLGYLDHAELVLTNSFHCTAFSVLLQKNFFAVKKKSANSRIVSLLESAGLSSRLIDRSQAESLEPEALKTVYPAEDKLTPWIEASKEFLHQALEED